MRSRDKGTQPLSYVPVLLQILATVSLMVQTCNKKGGLSSHKPPTHSWHTPHGGGQFSRTHPPTPIPPPPVGYQQHYQKALVPVWVLFRLIFNSGELPLSHCTLKHIHCVEGWSAQEIVYHMKMICPSHLLPDLFGRCAAGTPQTYSRVRCRRCRGAAGEPQWWNARLHIWLSDGHWHPRQKMMA